jgi:hypothetical protein
VHGARWGRRRVNNNERIYERFGVTPSFRATARIVPAPCSYSCRICSYSSTLALLFSKTLAPD